MKRLFNEYLIGRRTFTPDSAEALLEMDKDVTVFEEHYWSPLDRKALHR